MFSIFRNALLLIAVVAIISCGQQDDNNGSDTDQKPDDIAVLNQKINKHPNNASLYNERALYYLEEQMVNEAVSDVNKALQIDSTNSDYYVTLGKIFMYAGKFGASRNVLLKSLSLDQENCEALLLLAEMHLFASDHKKTLEYLQKVEQIDKTNPELYFIRAFVFQEQGDTSNAILNLQFAVDNDQEFYDAYIQLGILHAAQNNDLAVDYYNNALNIDPNSVEAHYNLAMYYQEHEKLNEAMEEYVNILQIDNCFKHAHYNLGYINLEYLKVFNISLKHFTDAINCDPTYVEAYFNRGLSYEGLGDVINARKDYEKALELRGNYEKAIQSLNRLDKGDQLMFDQSDSE